MYKPSDKRRTQQTRILAGMDAQIELAKLHDEAEAFTERFRQFQEEARALRERFRQWCREAELGLRMLLDGGPPLAFS